MTANLDQMESRPRALPWWWIVLPWMAFVLAGFLYWLLRLRRDNPIQPVRIDLSFIRRQAQPAATEGPLTSPAVEPASAPVGVESPVSDPVATPVAESTGASPDDLTVISGIGPKIAVLLQEAGVTTFAQLEKADLEHLRALLREANFRLADPSGWAAQARLAAAGKWEELKTLIVDQRSRRSASSS